MTNFIDGYAILTKFDIRNGLVSALVLCVPFLKMVGDRYLMSCMFFYF